jgi:hypothetical protein
VSSEEVMARTEIEDIGRSFSRGKIEAAAKLHE